MKRKTFNLWKVRLLRTVYCICVGAVLYVYLGTQLFSITAFTFTGVDDKDKESLALVLHNTVAQKILKVFPGNKIFTFNIRKLRANVQAILPNTSIVTIYPTGIHTLHVTVVPYTPLFRLKDGMTLDTEGIIYKEQHDVSGLPILDVATSSIPDSKELAQLHIFIPKVQTILFPVTYIRIDSSEDMYMYSEMSSSTLILAQNPDFKKVWSNLVSALDTDPLKTKMSQGKNNLMYVDLRFGNKVFYKFTNVSTAGIIDSSYATTTATTTLSR